jgi:hypothetical protein
MYVKTGEVRINVAPKSVRVTIDTVEKQKSITYSKCVSVVLVVQRGMRMCHIVICDLAGPSIIFVLSHKRPEFRVWGGDTT